MKQLPHNVKQYRSTREFDELTTPDALQHEHRTRPGVWGRIVVLEGKLLYRILTTDEEHQLTPDHPGVVEPATPHLVEPLGKVRFLVEFWR